MQTRRNGLIRRTPSLAKSLRSPVSRAAYETLERRNYMAANLVISEFMASNDHSIVDSFGLREDWIEIHNAGDAPANLADYFLTDSASQPTQWQFPSKTIDPNGYQIVFASGLNVVTAGGEMHTNFKLSASGEYLGLTRASDSGVQFEYAPTFPAQTPDISYGLADANNPTGARAYSTSPTPGAQNAPSVDPVVFSTPGKVFTGSIVVSLTSTTPGAQIRYTLDRTAPTATSPLYTGPLTVTSLTMIRAQAFNGSYLPSPITSQTYVSASAADAAFNTDLPIVILSTFGQTFNDQVSVSAAATLIDTATGTGRAQMLDTPNFSGRIALRYRGSTSYNYPKKQYQIELQDESNADKDASLLGMPAESDWILYAPYTERSLMNNQLAMKWATGSGHYASRTRYVEAYVNTGGTTLQYAGVYILMEKIKAGAERVDVNKMKPTDVSGEAVTGGYIFKKDRVEATEKSFTTSLKAQKFGFVTPDELDLVQAQQDYITGYMNNFESALYSANFADPVNGYAKYIDVDSFVDYWLVVEMTRNIDGFWLSTFYSKDINSKVKIGPVWDFNLALGAANYQQSSNSQGWDTDTLTDAQSPYYKRLMQDPNFVQKLSDRWQEMRSGIFSNASLNADINANIDLLTDHTGQPTSNTPVGRNFNTWAELGVYVTTGGFYDPQGRWLEDVNLMRNWLLARVDWMDSKFVGAPALTPGGSFFGTKAVTVTPKSNATALDTIILDQGAPALAYIPGITGPTALTGWQQPGFTPTGWISGTTGIGYDTITTDVNFLPSIGLNVQAMRNNSFSAYARINFTLTQAQIDDFAHLILKMKYDDGFTAWVNGVRVADLNTPENTNPTNSTKSATDRDDTKVLTFDEYDISSIKNYLVVGTNTLALQGMNTIIGSNDFLLLPQLVLRKYQTAATGSVYYTTDGSDPRAAGGGVSPTALLYSGALNLSTNTHIRARTLVNGLWSAIADQSYDFTPDTLRVTELMYHPTVNENYEYLELKNTGTTAIDLTGYRFDTGISFVFPTATLAPGAYAVIVKDPASFTARYGTGINVIGTYTGSLDNAGEQIILNKTINGVLTEVQNFTYDDTGTGWYPQTDGDGYSLVIRDATNTDKSTWSSAAAWRASYNLQGLPGMADDDNVAPTIASAAFSPTTSALQVSFNEAVKIAASAGWTITNLDTNTTITPASITASDNVATISLPSLASGVYRLSLATNGVTDTSNNPIAAAFAWSMIYVQNGQTYVLPPVNTARVVNQIAVGTAATLDLQRNSVIVRNGTAGTWSATGYDGLTGLIVSGRNGGAWNGTGITTSTITAGNTLGLGTAADLLKISGNQTALWQGITVNPGDVLIRYTLAGDANLDGTVNFDDLIVLAQNYGGTGKTFATGNLDLSADGSANFDDLIGLAQNYNKSLPTLAVVATPTVKRKPSVASGVIV